MVKIDRCRVHIKDVRLHTLIFNSAVTLEEGHKGLWEQLRGRENAHFNHQFPETLLNNYSSLQIISLKFSRCFFTITNEQRAKDSTVESVLPFLLHVGIELRTAGFSEMLLPAEPSHWFSLPLFSYSHELRDVCVFVAVL